MKRRIIPAILIASIAFGSCSSGDSTIESGGTIKLLAYDAFTPEPEIFTSFTKETGIDVIVSLGGDTGTLVSKALLTAGTPEADVLWGVDNTLISRAIDGKLFESYQEVDTAAVCVNYDKDYFAKNDIAPPSRSWILPCRYTKTCSLSKIPSQVLQDLLSCWQQSQSSA